MDNIVAERIIDSLAFEVEALPQENVLEISDTSKATPLNVKIRVRKKDKALFKQGVVSVPKLGHPKKSPERIRLVSSDHTVLSFKVFVDTRPDKKPAKKRKRFFGGCLSSEDNDDDPYVDSNPTTAPKSADIMNPNFGLSKTPNVQTMQLQPKKPVMFLGNRCKPGGCLDPPLDEDKYSYEPNNNILKVFEKEHSETEKQKHDLLTDETIMKKETTGSILKETIPAEWETNKEEIEPDNKSVQSIYQAGFIKSSLDAQYSISIMTYPTSEIADDISDKSSNPKKSNDEQRKSFPEFRDSYFIPPKTTSNNKKNSDADNGIQKVESNLTGQHTSESKKIFSKAELEENTFPNLKSINDPKIRSSIENEKNHNKTNTLLEETSNLIIDANELQSENDLEPSKEKHTITTALKTGAVIATPLLIAEAAMQKIKSDKHNNIVQNEHQIGNNSINTEFKTSTHAMHERKEEFFHSLNENAGSTAGCTTDIEIKEPQSSFDSLSNDIHKKKEEKESSKDENTTFTKSGDTISNFSDTTKTEKNELFLPTNLENNIPKDINDISAMDTNSFKEIARKTGEDDTSHQYLNAQDKTTGLLTTAQLINQAFDKHPNNEDNLSRVEADKGKENKDIVSQISSHILDESDKISPNVENIKEQQQNLFGQQGFSDKRTSSMDEKRKSVDSNALVESEDINKDQREGSLKSSMSDKTNVNDIKSNTQHSDNKEANKDQRKGSLESSMSNKVNVNDEKNNLQHFDEAQFIVVTDSDQDADLSDKILIQKQNDDFFENNIHNNKHQDKSDKHDIKNEEKNQDNKNQDLVLSDNTFDLIQNNYPLDNNSRYNENKNNQRDTEHMLRFKEHQKTTTDGNEHDKDFDIFKDNTLEPAHHQIITPSDKGRNTEEKKINVSFSKLNDIKENINKTSEKYNEHYERKYSAYNYVNMDISFHSYINDQNESVIKTLDTLRDVKRRPQDNVTIIKSQIQLNTPYVIKIPIDNHKNIILEVEATDHQKRSAAGTADSDTCRSDNDEKLVVVPPQQSQTSIPEIESVQNLLSAIYEQQLLPLQSLISDLKKDVDILTSQQMWLKENWKRSKRTKTIGLTHSSRKCGCFRQLNVKK